MRKLILGLCFLGVIPLTSAASFDCSKSSTAIEKSICNKAVLSKLDEALTSNYKNISAANIGTGARKNLQITQRKWLQQRNQCKTDRCIESKYRERLDQICEVPVISGVHPECVYSSDI